MSKKALILSVLTFSLLLAACRLLTVELTATPETIIAGEESTLTWNTTYADTVTIEPGIGSVTASGATSVSPTATTTYTITATGVDGSTVTDSVTVTVNTPAPVVSITAEPESIIAGEASTLTWDSTNADTVNIDPDIGDVAASGTISVSPTSTTTYTIGFKIINLARLEGGSCIMIPRRPITQPKLIILKPILRPQAPAEQPRTLSRSAPSPPRPMLIMALALMSSKAVQAWLVKRFAF